MDNTTRCYVDLIKETPVPTRKANYGVVRRQTIRRVWFADAEAAQNFRAWHALDDNPTITISNVTCP